MHANLFPCKIFYSLCILCHQENTIMVNLATALEKEGIRAFRFDFSGNGYASIPVRFRLLAIVGCIC